MQENIPVVLQDLPPHIKGFICLGSDYSPIIVLNSRLSVEQQRKTFWHEISHLERGDLDNEDYSDNIEYGDVG